MPIITSTPTPQAPENADESQTQAFGRSALKGLSFGTSNYWLPLFSIAGSRQPNESWTDAYTRLQKHEEQMDATNHKNYPITTDVGEVAGAIPSFIGGEGLLAKGGEKLLEGAGKAYQYAKGLKGATEVAEATPQVASKLKQAAGVVVGDYAKASGTGAVKGGILNGAYSGLASDGQDTGINTQQGAVVGAILGGIGGPLGKAVSTILKKFITAPKAMTPSEQLYALNTFKKKGVNIDDIRDLQNTVRQNAIDNGTSIEDSWESLANKYGEPATASEKNGFHALAPFVDALHPGAGKVAQMAGDLTSKQGDSQFVSGTKQLFNSKPDSTAPVVKSEPVPDVDTGLVDKDGNPIMKPGQQPATPAPDNTPWPVPKAPEPSTTGKVIQGAVNAVKKVPKAYIADQSDDQNNKSIPDKDPGYEQDLINSEVHVMFPNKQSPEDAKDYSEYLKKRQAAEATVQSVGIDPKSPDGQAKIDGLVTPSTSDNNVQEGSQVTDDVPNVVYRNALKTLITPSGQEIELS